jgi:hypothetical protein
MFIALRALKSLNPSLKKKASSRLNTGDHQPLIASK